MDGAGGPDGGEGPHISCGFGTDDADGRRQHRQGEQHAGCGGPQRSATRLSR